MRNSICVDAASWACTLLKLASEKVICGQIPTAAASILSLAKSR